MLLLPELRWCQTLSAGLPGLPRPFLPQRRSQAHEGARLGQLSPLLATLLLPLAPLPAGFSLPFSRVSSLFVPQVWCGLDVSVNCLGSVAPPHPLRHMAPGTTACVSVIDIPPRPLRAAGCPLLTQGPGSPLGISGRDGTILPTPGGHLV